MSDDFWGEPIYEYTDKQAIEDGVLVDLAPLGLRFRGMPINRMTVNLYQEFEPFVVAEAPLFGGNENLSLANILRTKLELAYYKGDIWQIPPNIWLLENEVDGWTLMYPEDY